MISYGQKNNYVYVKWKLIQGMLFGIEPDWNMCYKISVSLCQCLYYSIFQVFTHKPSRTHTLSHTHTPSHTHTHTHTHTHLEKYHPRYEQLSLGSMVELLQFHRVPWCSQVKKKEGRKKKHKWTNVYNCFAQQYVPSQNFTHQKYRSGLVKPIITNGENKMKNVKLNI